MKRKELNESIVFLISTELKTEKFIRSIIHSTSLKSSYLISCDDVNWRMMLHNK